MFATVTPDAEAPWLEGLNEQQLAAVLHDDGPLLVVAGAGSGKTRTIAARVARLLGDGADPDRVLLLTFSRRASREMLRRAERLGADRATARVWGGTFHAMGNRLLREHGRAVGLSPGFTILDHGDAVDLMGVVRAALGLAERGRRFPKKDTLLDIYSRVANAREKLSDTLKERFPWCQVELDDMRRVFEGYAERKRERGMLDYDDLLLYWRALVTVSPAADHLRGRFDYILVDEYQDTNLLQADILSGLTPSGRGLFVVGDDAQAIYGFRAASAANMEGFLERFPAATAMTLDRNYRSVQPILDAANALMAGEGGVFAKDLHAARPLPVGIGSGRPVLASTPDEGAEASFVCEKVLEHRENGVALREQAVLFRTGHHSGRLEIELSRRHIPFVKYGGLKFLEAAHIKDLLAFLRLLENPSDELAWHRVLGLLEGVGPATSRHVLEQLALPNPSAVRSFVDNGVEVPPRAAPDIELVRATFGACLDEEHPPAAEIDAVRTHSHALFERRYPDARARLTDFEQLEAVANACPSRGHFLAELTIDPPSRTSDLAGPPLLDDDWLVLSTIHSAKGSEWDVVFVIHASDGNLPSDMALTGKEGLDEERRLFYVAITRARDALYVTYPLRYYIRRFALDDQHDFAQPSRFLSATAGLFDEPTLGEIAPFLTGVETPEGGDTVGTDLSALWS